MVRKMPSEKTQRVAQTLSRALAGRLRSLSRKPRRPETETPGGVGSVLEILDDLVGTLRAPRNTNAAKDARRPRRMTGENAI
jgi:hypothetical protein